MDTKSKAKKTFRYLLLDTVPTEADKEITTAKLPTSKQVLLCYLAHLKDYPSRVAANITAEKVIHIFNKARIPVLQPHKVTEEVLKAHKTLLKIGKISKVKRDLQNEKMRIFKEDLSKTFKAWPRDCMQQIDNSEDKDFFQSMLTDREASMIGIDKTLSTLESNKRKRKMVHEKRIEKQQCKRLSSCLN